LSNPHQDFPYRPDQIDYFKTSKSENYYEKQYQKQIKEITRKYWQEDEYSGIAAQLEEMQVPLSYNLTQKDLSGRQNLD